MSARNENWNETAWEPNRSLAGPCRGAMEEQLESLKEQLLIPLLSSVENAALIRELRWVANEAAALAWFTVCPVLVLPALLEEKVRAALQRWERQQLLWKRHMPVNATAENSPDKRAPCAPEPRAERRIPMRRELAMPQRAASECGAPVPEQVSASVLHTFTASVMAA